MYNLQGGDAVHFVQALARADVRDIPDMTWHGFSGATTAEGKPQVIDFHPRDQKRIMAALGIAHWGDNVQIIMDDNGISFNGWQDDAGFANDVTLQLQTVNWDGDFATPRGLFYQPEVAYPGPNDALRFKRSFDPSNVDTWAVYARKPRGDGMDCLERFSSEKLARRYVEREQYR